MTKPRTRFSQREYGVYMTYGTIFSQAARSSDMELYLSQIPLHRALSFFAGISTLIDNFNGSSYFDLQKEIVISIGGGLPYASRIIDELVDPRMLISAEQMAVLQKFAVLHSPEYMEADPGDLGDLLLRLMLSYNDLRGKEAIIPGNKDASLLASELRSTFRDEELTPFLVDLYWQFFKWSETSEARTSANFLDINADLQQLRGFSYVEYAASAFAYLARSLNARSIADLSWYDSWYDPIFEIDLYLKNLAAPGLPRRWLAENAVSLGEARTAFAASSLAPYSGFSLQALMDRPFLLLDADHAVCPHRAFLENKIGTGMFFLLLDAYNKADGNRIRSDKLTRFFGEFFEAHCVALAKRTHPSPDLVFGEQAYSGGKSTDLVIFEDNGAVFIDIAIVRLALQKTVIELNAESIDRDIDKILANAKQMTGAIAAFRDGRLVYRKASGEAIDPRDISRIYPVALIVASVPRLWQFNKMLYERLGRAGYLQDTEPFEVLSARDYDLVMRLVRGGSKVSELLQRKFHHRIPIARQASFWHYLATYDEELLSQARAVDWAGVRDSWFAELSAVIRTWGLELPMTAP